METGYIKLFKQFITWEWYTDIPVKTLFLHFLLKANYQNKKWQGVDIIPGQFVTSLEHLAQETGLTISQVRTAMKKLKTTEEIASKSHSRYSVITVKNWDRFQQDDKQIANKSQTNRKQIATTKEIKKERINKFINLSLINEEEREILKKIARKRNAVCVDAYVNTIIANGTYKTLLEEEKQKQENKQAIKELNTYKPLPQVRHTPEEEINILNLIEKGRKRNKKR